MCQQFGGHNMNVVSLARFASRDSVAVLEALLEKALQGELTGLAVCFEDRKGREDCALTGCFARRPDRAAAAALRLSMRVASNKGEYDHFP